MDRAQNPRERSISLDHSSVGERPTLWRHFLDSHGKPITTVVYELAKRSTRDLVLSDSGPPGCPPRRPPAVGRRGRSTPSRFSPPPRVAGWTSSKLCGARALLERHRPGPEPPRALDLARSLLRWRETDALRSLSRQSRSRPSASPIWLARNRRSGVTFSTVHGKPITTDVYHLIETIHPGFGPVRFRSTGVSTRSPAGSRQRGRSTPSRFSPPPRLDHTSSHRPSAMPTTPTLRPPAGRDNRESSAGVRWSAWAR